jgi:hypothetical protein
VCLPPYFHGENGGKILTAGQQIEEGKVEAHGVELESGFLPFHSPFPLPLTLSSSSFFRAAWSLTALLFFGVRIDSVSLIPMIRKKTRKPNENGDGGV